MTGGEPRAVTDIPSGAGAPAWAPDGKAIAFSSSARPDELPGGDKAAAKPSNGEEAKRQSDVRVITDAAYRANGISGAGYVDADRTSQIWVTTLPDSNSIAAPRQVTTGEFGAANHQWSPDGNDIYFVSNRRREAYYYPDDSDLYAVSRRGGEPRRVADIDGKHRPVRGLPRRQAHRLHRRSERQSPSGPTISPTSGSPTSPAARRATSPPPTTSTSAARSAAISARRAASIRRPRSGRPTGARILVRVGEQGNAVLASVDAASGRVDRTIASRDVMSYTADAAGRRLAAVISTPTTLGDLYVLDGPAAVPVEADQLQRRTVQRPGADRARGDLVSELRRTPHPGLDPQAARLRSAEEVPAHPADPRRAALGLRQHLHPRVRVDGGEGLRGALHQPARQLQLRAGIRQHHPVQLPGRRLQGSDGGSRCRAQEGLHRRDGRWA